MVGVNHVQNTVQLTLLGGLIFPLPRPDIIFSLPLYQTLPRKEFSGTKTKRTRSFKKISRCAVAVARLQESPLHEKIVAYSASRRPGDMVLYRYLVSSWVVNCRGERGRKGAKGGW
jgi:hypothetical protein